MSNLLNHFLNEMRRSRIEELAKMRGADPMLSQGPSARFMGRIEFDGETHYYDSRTHVCERRKGAGRIPSGKRTGWIVSRPFDGNGHKGLCKRYDAYVIRPKSKAEMEEDIALKKQRAARVLAKRALPWSWRIVCSNSGYNRKGVLRCYLWSEQCTDRQALREKILPGFVYAPTRKNSSGEIVPAGSCYGPRTRNILKKLGCPEEKIAETLSLCGFRGIK